ncbi:RNA polymerase sigma factor [Sphingobacterium chuzhouense]|uniref:Sigma-70 family RNA polymerase sigma factor n=1 Tax=Sphingobacterium chuzhouense TaxID=1742264 RepID=A0ABR7XPH6_9SPHI|nr:sigma-70 family RNA polymerase sigma factor [Sphingobacterium chuzhouense]MBD1421074.1 sigma-70 family RNA polymerase sigma factor [Sphingobacterium chuzhouense]
MTNTTARVYGGDENTMFMEFLKGSSDAFSYFYTFFINDLYAYGISLGGSEDIVKDAIQDIFLKIHSNNQKKFSSIEHLKFFLLKSLKNKLYNIYTSKMVSTASPITEEALEFSISTTVLDTIINEEDRIIIQQKIDNLLTKLTARQKEAIYLRFIQELEYAEIAEILNMTQHGVRKLISRSLKRLRGEEQLLLIYLLKHFCS